MNEHLLPSFIFMAILVLFSAYFSATETAFSSLNKTRLRTMAEKGNKKAALACQLAEQYDRMLSTILIGNNIVNIALASIGTVLFVDLYGDLGATISTVVVTIVVLIFGEISPKSLAKDVPEQFAMLSAPFLKVLIWVLTPINFLFTLWKQLLSKLFKVPEEHKMTQDELLMLVEEVKQDGTIDEDESNLLRSAIEFTDREVEEILTHRVDLTGVPLNASKETVAQVFAESRYSRLLVYEETIDHIVGVIHQKDFYTGNGITQQSIADIMTIPLFVPESIKISDVLKLLQKNKSHIAVVSDEYGGTLGIVTMEDILEELVGEIWDEHDEIDETIVKVDAHTYVVSCNTDLDDMFTFFNLTDETEANSISGWVIEQMGKIPNEGDSFIYGSWLVTVTNTDYRRVLEITMTEQNKEAENNEEPNTGQPIIS